MVNKEKKYRYSGEDWEDFFFSSCAFIDRDS